MWIGLISYPRLSGAGPADLWPGYLDRRPVLARQVGLVAASVVLAYLTYRLLENRVRSTRGFAVPVILLVALVATALVGQAVADGRIDSR